MRQGKKTIISQFVQEVNEEAVLRNIEPSDISPLDANSGVDIGNAVTISMEALINGKKGSADLAWDAVESMGVREAAKELVSRVEESCNQKP